MKMLCIYHGNCADGFGAAWCVRRAFGEDAVEFHAGVHQTPPPDVTDRDVIIVDFSYKRPVLLDMAAKARSILIIDHHKSAAADLRNIAQDAAERGCCPIKCFFDMEHSGAMLTWLMLFPDEEPYPLLRTIEDRDLWRFRRPNTREIQAALFSYPYDFDVWDELMVMPADQLAAEGRTLERKHFKDIREFIEVAAFRAEIAGHDVPVLNAPYFWSSDAGHILGEHEPFAACYWDVPDGRVFSLRSADDGLDVSVIAVQFGGGGHAHAAGFKVPKDHPLAAL